MAERIGGHGFQHRRIRRAEEITWLLKEGITAVLSLLDGNHNLTAYEEAGLLAFHQPLPLEIEEASDVEIVFSAIQEALTDPDTALLVHRDIVDDTVAGILAGYLVHAGMIEDPIFATSLIQQILGRPLGPEGRRLIPAPAA